MAIVLPMTDPMCIPTAARMLGDNEIVAFPTDTVYGIGGNLYSYDAIQKLYQVKIRRYQKAIAVLIGDLDQLSLVTKKLTPIAAKLASKYWPGALTLVLPKLDGLPDNLSPYPTVGIRMPDYWFALELLKNAGPLATTSANISGQKDLVTCQEVVNKLGEKIKLIVDGGKTPGGIPSTVVDCTQSFPVVLREGSISKQEIINLINNGMD
jgi:L-threonylcarbamoyladenylate synthase